ncbi:peptidoglycan DD-metalloendopeptidase family protein [Niallia sp. Krafla_26]|uniref:peptidoglycan DD-metalloendopeptidase family protein n=1 Tax=Niallia sp. Krafla_26 TaxID=3064703 RepID=UPI003D175D17
MREEEKKQASLKKFFKKRWVYPTVYIASAALILTGVLWFQNSNTENATESDKFGYETSNKENQFNEPAEEVARSMENIVLPLSEKDRTNAVIKTKFYEDTANEADQEAAIVVYQNQYHPNTGIDISVKDSEAFDVVAALSGTVTNVQEDALLGNVIEIEHDDNIVTRYSSVKDMKIAVGDKVEQGQALATAGKSLFNEEAGVHVHFEIRKNDVPVNPESYLDKPFSELQEASVIEQDEATASEKPEIIDSEKSKEDQDKEATEDPAKDEKSSIEEEKPASDDKESSNEEEETSTDEEKPEDEKKDESTNKTKNQDA